MTRFVLSMVILFIFCLSFASAECLDRMSKSISVDPPNFKHGLRRISLSIVLGIVTGLICALSFTVLVRNFVRYINKSPIVKSPVVFSPKISPRTLKSALSDELGGSSTSGKYYKAVLDNGLTVAVKIIDGSNNRTSKKKVERELGVISGLRHRNLMSLRAYVCESGGHSLVYDYVPNGSLEDVMRRTRDNRLELKWEFRHRIAVGIVKGLHYLHFSCEPMRLHFNLKPSNVMLDAEYEPRLADCGLATITPDFCRATSGYNAPECFQNCRYTDKSDVYSFGVVLGVLLTGRDPMDPLFGGSLEQWLKHLQEAGEAREALDKSILGDEMEEEEMLMAVRIAVVCLSDMPAERPSSDELVSMLTQLNSQCLR